MKEKIFIDSIDSIDYILLKSKISNLDENIKEQLWSYGMNYFMMVESKAAANAYLKKINKLLGDDAKILIEESQRILSERFPEEQKVA